MDLFPELENLSLALEVPKSVWDLQAGYYPSLRRFRDRSTPNFETQDEHAEFIYAMFRTFGNRGNFPSIEAICVDRHALFFGGELITSAPSWGPQMEPLFNANINVY